MILLASFHLGAADPDLFGRYEAQALPLLARHGGVLQRRLRSLDRMTETHILYFPAQAALDAYLADPDRAALQSLWSMSGAAASVTAVVDLPVLPPPKLP